MKTIHFVVKRFMEKSIDKFKENGMQNLSYFRTVRVLHKGNIIHLKTIRKKLQEKCFREGLSMVSKQRKAQ